MFGNGKKAAAQALKAERDRMAADQDRAAKEYARRAAKARKLLDAGSSDPAADREELRTAEANQRICELNARDLRR